MQVRQSNIPDLDNAGRLFFRSELVELRSEEETRILALIEAAELSEDLLPLKPGVIPYSPGPIFGRQGLERIRQAILNYVRSEEYVDVWKNGPQDTRPMWQRFRNYT